MFKRTHPTRIAPSFGCLLVLAALTSCSRTPELTPAAIQTLVDTRTRALLASDAATLCSQYSESARFHGVFGDEQLVLPKSRYCEQLAQDFAAAAGQGQRFVTTLSVQSLTIAPNRKEADLVLEQVDVAGNQPDSKPFERRTQIRARVESVAGKPMIIREEQRETIREVSELPRNSPTVSGASEPALSGPQLEAELKKLEDDIYANADPSIPEKDRRAIAKSMAADAREIVRDLKASEDPSSADRERAQNLEREKIMKRECDESRQLLAALEQIVRDGPRERMTPAELAAIPGSVKQTKDFLAQSCR
ncbi:MAG: hypothetical protein H7Y02_01810 [Candidatus Obscuribacterales bacterium]|nr:hypothetical protein [Steroidobacteraceae bacterium]